MDFRHHIASLDAVAASDADALLVVLAGDVLDAGLDPRIATPLADAIKHGDFQLKAGKSVYLHRPAGIKPPRLVACASGATTLKAVKAALAAGLGQLKGSGAKHVAVAVAGAGELGASHAEALVTAAMDATYVYRHTKPSAPAAAALARVTLLCTKPAAKAVAQGLARGQAIAAGVTLAREWANRPGNHCTPTHLGEQAKKLGKEFGLKVQVLDRKAVARLGMGSFLAVAQGSDEPLRFIVAQYHGAPRTQAPVVLVGKGITFDTGGISIKPAPEMDEMKFDMGGAASVLGTLRAVAELKPRLNLVVIVPTCENMPGGRAVKPGDVVTSMSGQTIEILNTDAEGRLILCDALTYAERFKPAVVVDVATLTGACVIALGHHHTGLFTADDALAGQLLDASRAALDPAWRMPLDEEYDEALKSNFADMGNVGGRAGGAITAAMFLKRFTGKYRWAHLDIAGTAWRSGASKGATGRPVALLTHFVLAQAGDPTTAAMTEVSFHFNVPDRLDYVCRFLRKAVRKGATVVVQAPPPTLAALDRALWSFDPIDFVPHVRLQPGEAPPTRLASTPVWLAEPGTDPGHHDVLLNLCDDPPAGFESYARVIEIVSREPDQREAARLRWKHYAGRGYPIVRHEVND